MRAKKMLDAFSKAKTQCHRLQTLRSCHGIALARVQRTLRARQLVLYAQASKGLNGAMNWMGVNGELLLGTHERDINSSANIPAKVLAMFAIFKPAAAKAEAEHALAVEVILVLWARRMSNC
jgi:hypothetical protein